MTWEEFKAFVDRQIIEKIPKDALIVYIDCHIPGAVAMPEVHYGKDGLSIS